MNLETDTELTEHCPDHYRAELSSKWNVWGMNGGYLAAIALRAAGASAPWDRPVAISASFVSRARPGAADVTVEVVRRTSKAQCSNVVMVQQDTPIVTATVWCTADGPQGNEPQRRTLPPPETVPTLLERLENHESTLQPWQITIEDRPLDFPDDRKAGGPAQPTYEAWFRYRPKATFASPWLNAARVLIVADIYPVLGYVRAAPGSEVTCRAATISLSVQFHRSTDQEEFLFGECRVLSATQGLLSTATSVWSRKGECCAMAIQQNLLLA